MLQVLGAQVGHGRSLRPDPKLCDKTQVLFPAYFMAGVCWVGGTARHGWAGSAILLPSLGRDLLFTNVKECALTCAVILCFKLVG